MMSRAMLCSQLKPKPVKMRRILGLRNVVHTQGYEVMYGAEGNTIYMDGMVI